MDCPEASGHSTEDFRDDQDVRMGEPFPAHACRQSQAVPLADGHADVTVPLYETLSDRI